jgi:hypothetical protein
MAFPTSPTNGQTVVVNNVSYQYSNVSNSWTRILSTANIITANTVVSNGYISAAGNILTGNYFIGNGALLTGISTNPAAITNGTSNVSVVSSGGNVSVGIGGTGNVAVFATTGEYVTGILSASGNIISASNVTGGNLLTAGAISATGTLSVTGATTLGTASTGNLSAGNVTTGGIVSAAGNITGNNLSITTFANVTTLNSAQGANITGTLIATSANAQFFNQTNSSGYFSAAGNILGNLNLSIAGNVTGGNLLTGGLISATSTITSAANITGGNILTAGLISAIGSITSAGNLSLTGNIVDAGELWINTSSNGNINLNPNGTGQTNIPAGILSVTGNIEGGNLRTAGLVSATANITGGNLLTAGLISATSTITSAANVTGGNLLTGGVISATGNIISANNIIASKVVTANDNIVINSTGAEGGQLVLAWANVNGLVSQGNSTWNLDTDSGNSFRLFYQNGAAATGVLLSASPSTNVVAFPSSAGVSVTGNITGGNLLTAGIASVTGTITTAGSTNSTGFAVGNGAVSNVGLGFFPTAGTPGEYAIRDYSTVTNSIYFDVGMGGTANGSFQFRTSNAFRSLATINSTGVNTPLAVSATGNVTGNYFIGNGSQLTGIVASAGSSLVNGTSNVVVAASGNVTVGVAGTAAVATFTTAGVVSNSVSATNNGAGTNFKVGDDVWLGDINLADTMSVRGQQNFANGYIVFGNADGTQLGRAGSGPLTYGGAFSATGNVTGGNLLTAGLISSTGTITGSSFLGTVVSVTANVTGGNVLTGGLISVTGTLSVSGATTLANLSAGNISSGGITSGGAVSAAGNVTGGNLVTVGLISATGNITGNYFLGNGSALTGIIPGGTTTFSNIAPVSPAIGDVWIQANTAVQYIYFNDTTSNQWAEMEAYQSFSSGSPSSSSFTWNIANSNITMTASNGYFVDTTGGAKTMTLPASAVIGDTVRINDLAGTFGANNLTVARNSSNIQGVAQDLLVSVNQSSFGLVYSNSTYGWKLLEL